ncbi:phosphoenolpyruvate carboxykinase (ATP) [Texcoconibacillus texcoconensis]|uniref:Phosphoenolpyruvate carboxykinase (ATP) n=1 Tax=Texcoconibacillus texcoconensis TaxID=1095777 RepID=A0A840QNA5_9BACI|nr:phosphoenolpyruvate carboxykinase (ATP) [Texcoconibacillus texcoconensis]MBB5172823.1 phosphoenolpyruvate carboxykinase (ATP) [Texcoconibacillus texcoconensis]
MSMVHFESEIEHLISKKGVHEDLPVSLLVEKSLERKEGMLTETGALQVTTGAYTGRSPKDRFIVDEPPKNHEIDWGPINQPIDADIFERLYFKVIEYLKTKDDLFVRHAYAGADSAYRLPIRVINEYAWHNLFAGQLFIQPKEEELENILPEFTVIQAPGFKADPEIDGTRSEAFVMISFAKRTILIGGTEYAGEMKKGIFSVMNGRLPDENVLPMHCSANVGEEGDVALFFGLSGTGKTTLSADEQRQLIGDDEHAWSANGVFNIEGGCYAKCIGLSKEKEPQIYDAIKFGAVLENVVLDQQTRMPNYNDNTLTENTRAAYPLTSISNTITPSIAGHPTTIIFLTADAFGVLPPISELTREQAMYHFLSGYTSKLAGTERGVTKPEATFSTCFGSPFLPLHANRYAEMLGEKIVQHDAKVFLVNTGWSGGPYGEGERIKLRYTRAMIQAALLGELNDMETNIDPTFNVSVPLHCPGVPDEVLWPRLTWTDTNAYDQKAKELANKFNENFKKFTSISPAIQGAGPNV